MVKSDIAIYRNFGQMNTHFSYFVCTKIMFEDFNLPSLLDLTGTVREGVGLFFASRWFGVCGVASGLSFL